MAGSLIKIQYAAKAVLTALAFLILIQTACASISSAQMLFDNGTVAVLGYDSDTQSYADGSTTNRNVLVKICATDAADLQNKFAGIFYKVGDTATEIDVLPAKMVSIDGSVCATVDLDVSLFKARYAGIPNIGVADDPGMTSPTYVQLETTDGWMSGDFEVTYTDSGVLSTSVSKALTETGTEITLSRPYLVLGVKDATDTVIDSALVELDESTSLTKPSTAFTFNVNGIDVTGTSAPAAAAAAAETGPAEAPHACIFKNTFDKIVPENPARIMIDDYCTYLRQIDFGSGKTISNINVVVRGNIDIRGNTPPYGQVLQYGEITANTEDFSIVKVIFRVPKTWIANNSINEQNGVKLNRYTDSWERLSTTKIDEDSDWVYYESYSKGLSYFAITGEQKAVTVQFCGDGKCLGTESFITCPQDCPGPAVLAFLPSNWLLFVIIAIIIITTISLSKTEYFKTRMASRKIRAAKLETLALRTEELPPAPELPRFEIPKLPATIEQYVPPILPAIKWPELHPAILEGVGARIERHPHPAELLKESEAESIQRTKAPRFMPETAHVAELSKRMARLQKKLNLAQVKISSNLEKTSLMRESAARHAKYLKSTPAKTRMPLYIKQVKEETSLAEKMLEGKVKPARKRLPKPQFRIDHKIKPPEVKKLVKNMPKNLKEVSETFEGIDRKIKHESKN